MFGSTDDHIRASSCIVQHSVGARDGTIPSVVFNTDGGSSQRGHITVANNIVARDGEHDRSFHNDGVSIRDSRHTTSGTDGLDLEIVSGRMLERERELRQVFTRNFNAIHIPNIGGCISGGSGNRHSRTCANCVVGDSSGGADVFDIGNFNGTRCCNIFIISMPEVYTMNSTVIIRVNLIVRIQKLENPTLNTGHTTCIISCILCDFV